MPRLALPIALLALLLVAACDDGEQRAEPPPRPPAVQQRTQPLWCPKARYEQQRRDDGRYDVERQPHGTFDARRLVGRSLSDAEQLAQRNECTVRVVARDGERLAVTEDLRPNRINVTVDRGYVTALQSVG